MITQISYANDPTILAWETGNELKGAPAAWTSDITSYIKALAPQQLTMDGSYGPQEDALSLASVDIYSDHFYPPDRHRLRSNAKLVHSHQKACTKLILSVRLGSELMEIYQST